MSIKCHQKQVTVNTIEDLIHIENRIILLSPLLKEIPRGAYVNSLIVKLMALNLLIT